MIKKENIYDEWIETELKGVSFYHYDLQNGDKIIYSVNEYGLVDCFVIYIKELNNKYSHSQEELSIMNMLYIAGGEDLEELRVMMKLTYKSMIGEDLSYFGGMIKDWD